MTVKRPKKPAARKGVRRPAPPPLTAKARALALLDQWEEVPVAAMDQPMGRWAAVGRLLEQRIQRGAPALDAYLVPMA